MSAFALVEGRCVIRVAAALDATCTDTVRELGKLFQRLEGRSCAGVMLQRVDVSRDGIVWCVVRV